jgi:hypothetical protein
MALLPCPCGAKGPVLLWRKGFTHRYVMRCRVCKRESDVATTDFEQLDDKWNDTVRRAHRTEDAR